MHAKELEGSAEDPGGDGGEGVEFDEARIVGRVEKKGGVLAARVEALLLDEVALGMDVEQWSA